MVLPVLLPLLAALQSLPRPVSPAALPSGPELTVSPQQHFFIRGESVTLTCSTPSTANVSGIRLFRDGDSINSSELHQPQYNARSLQLSHVSETDAGAYSCESWRAESGREIPLQRSRPISITVIAPLPAPQLTVSPTQPIYITGEAVTLTCWATGAPTVFGIRFYRDSREIHTRDLPSSSTSHNESLPLSRVSAGSAGQYSCESWETMFGREIKSERSQPSSITVTDPPPRPQLSVEPPSGVVSEGIFLNITCTAPRRVHKQGFHFYKDAVELLPGDLGSEISTMEPGTGSVKVSVLSIPRAGQNITGKFTCAYEENVAGRWVRSSKSRAVKVPVSDSQKLRDILLGTGGVLLLVAALAALLCYCYCCRKSRAPSMDGSEPGECDRTLDPGCASKGSKGRGAGAEQAEQGSEITYAHLVLPTSPAHTTQSDAKAGPAEDEHVLYSEVVTTHVWKNAK